MSPVRSWMVPLGFVLASVGVGGALGLVVAPSLAVAAACVVLASLLVAWTWLLVGRGAADLAEVRQRLEQLSADLEAEVDRVRRVGRDMRPDAELLRQIEAITALRVRVADMPVPLPLSGGWRASPTTLLRYVELLTSVRPALVVECGSGVSCLWAGHALRQLGGGRCVALEHEPEFRREAMVMVSGHGLEEVVEVREAPLTSGASPWYDAAAFADLHDIDVVLVDGPPGVLARDARAPALEMLGPRMRVGGHILMDDSNRVDEARVIEQWVATGLVRVVDSARDYKGWTLLQYLGSDARQLSGARPSSAP